MASFKVMRYAHDMNMFNFFVFLETHKDKGQKLKTCVTLQNMQNMPNITIIPEYAKYAQYEQYATIYAMTRNKQIC
jgi:hypothetical protein